MEWSKKYKTLNTLFWLLLGLIVATPLAILAFTPVDDPDGMFVTAIVIAVLGILIVFAALCYVLRRYPRASYVKNGALVVERKKGDIIIELRDVTGCRVLGEGEASDFRRRSGSKGVMGRWGHYRSDSLGDFELYTRSMRDLHVFDLAGGQRYVVSFIPRSAEDFEFLKAVGCCR